MVFLRELLERIIDPLWGSYCEIFSILPTDNSTGIVCLFFTGINVLLSYTNTVSVAIGCLNSTKAVENRRKQTKSDESSRKSSCGGIIQKADRIDKKAEQT
ncbi:hypothetical protein [Aminicella lysinilytica]|uniref:Uncharacterized protein n=1 Tax=Aminicella lysinilytica TaxID=433323 RepID=A0A4R6PZN3_9FIRM|nr:hypothetical protein [Aminicella lysinilytica]TDP54364.1 hypothetical protein EV211_1221 [Aminicella lysinilytica]